MRKKIMKGMLAACMLLIGFVAMAQTSSNPVGKWDFNVPDAPYEYSKGKAEFTMKEGKLMLALTIDGQQAGQAFEAVKKDTGYVCNIVTDYFAMTVSLKPDGDNLKGTVSTDQWDMAIILTPEKK